LLALVTAAAACTPPASRPSADPPSRARLAAATNGDGARAAPTRRARLLFQIRGRPFPLPLVSGTLAGHPALMLVDTGANSHVVAGWLARKLGLPMKKLGDLGTDHVGRTIATFRIDNPDLAIDQWGPLEAGPVLATEVPDVIEKLGIGAFISPQQLAEDGDSVLLDLPNGELRAAWWDEAVYELSASGTPLVHGDQPHTCAESEGPIRGVAFVLPSTVEGLRAALLVDTGAQHSDLFTTSAAGQKLLPLSVSNREAMYTASGKISARKLRTAKVAAGSFEVTTDVDLIQGSADASCPRDGVLAMDVLRSCTLLLGRRQMYGSCNQGPAKPP
jgi:predicted aspartyl protease